MKIAIAGAGTTGAYAYRLLKQQGMQGRMPQSKGSMRAVVEPAAGVN